jgi:hypothetical protein
MSVSLCIYGNHSIAFDGKEIADKQDVLNRLNSLKFEDSEFIMEMCKQWHAPSGYSEESDLQGKEDLEQYLQIHSWGISFEIDWLHTDTIEYEFIGPYGLEVDITKYYVDIYIWVGRYYFWYDVTGKENIKWRNTWRLIIYQIIHVLGGDRALYLPDNFYDLSAYLPSYQDMPEFDQLIRIITKEYSAPFTSFAEAVAWYKKNDKPPFVIDKFEDVIKKQHLLFNGKTKTK